MALYKCPDESGPKLVPWSTGTDAEIKAMVDAYYDGTLSLSKIQSVWSVGDERTVNLEAMPASSPLTDTHVAQTVTFVIMNFNGIKLASDGTTDVLAIVGQKNCLKESGAMNSTDSNVWYACKRRTWCNNTYKNSLPSAFRSLFKEFNNVTRDTGYSTTYTTTRDYFSIFSMKEVCIDNTGNEGPQMAYYQTSANRKKKQGNDGSYMPWFSRSAQQSTNSENCRVIGSDGIEGYVRKASSSQGLSVFGCI